MTDTLPACPKCQSEYVYPDQNLLICPECGYEWDPNQPIVDEDAVIIKDAVGNVLAEGDKVLKVGTKATIKRFVAGDHDIDCKVDGAGDMMLKSSVVKKA